MPRRLSYCSALLLLAACGETSPPRVVQAQPPEPPPPPPILDPSGGDAIRWPDAGPPAAAPDASTPPGKPKSLCPAAPDGYSNAEVAALIEADFATLDAKDQGDAIYISLAHLAPDLDADALNRLRFGVGKLMNMMSWAPEIVEPAFIDECEQIVRVDTRDLSWPPAAVHYFVEVSENVAYGVLETEKATAFRADWLTAYLTRPPVYAYIMRSPATETEIEIQNAVLRPDRQTFSGVSHSVVSVHPRIIERRESDDGLCWITHDFLHRTQALAALETGLVPPSYVRFALQQYVAREYICELPNGMHAYHLTGFVSQRRWDGNTCVARNRSREDNLVLNGQCFSCHGNGLNPFQDEVRGRASPRPTAFIRENYPEQAEVQALLAADQARFVEAVSQIPFYEASFVGPLNTLMALYRDRTGDPLDASPAGAFGAILPGGVTAGPVWEDTVNPLATLAVDIGVLLPAEALFEVLPETLIPGLEERYEAVGIEAGVNCE